jgi:cell division protein FtsQ
MGTKRSRRIRAEEPLDEGMDAGAYELDKPKSTVAAIVKVLIGVGVALGAAFVVASGAYRFLTTTTRFAIERVEVQGSHRYGESDLLALAGIARGSNLFGVDLALAEQKLTADPWIESAHVARKLPDGLSITVEELTAAALASIDGTLYLVTRQGRPIKPLQDGDFNDYPVVTGVAGEQLGNDRKLAVERLANGITLIEQYKRLPVSQAFPPQEVALSLDGRVNMVVGVPAITLQLGRGNFRQKLLMGARIIGSVRAKGELPGIVFLDNEAHPERVVVRMR